jgi:hypothetical protein
MSSTLKRATLSIVRVEYGGENIGTDLQLEAYAGTGVALAIEPDIGPGESHDQKYVLLETMAAHDTWLPTRVSLRVTEKDPARDDQGYIEVEASARVVGQGVLATLAVPLIVAEPGSHRRSAVITVHLQWEVQPASVEPAGQHVPGPAPTEPLPEQFPAVANGQYDADVPVLVEADARVRWDAPIPPGASERERAAARFLTLNAGPVLPEGFVPELVLYRVASPQGTPIWVGDNSSMGARTQEQLLATLSTAIPTAGQPITDFEEIPSATLHLLRFRDTAHYALAAAAFADLVRALSEQEDALAQVERRVFTRRSQTGEFTEVRDHLMFVDPTPNHGPASHLWVIAWRDSSQE